MSYEQQRERKRLEERPFCVAAAKRVNLFGVGRYRMDNDELEPKGRKILQKHLNHFANIKKNSTFYHVASNLGRILSGEHCPYERVMQFICCFIITYIAYICHNFNPFKIDEMFTHIGDYKQTSKQARSSEWFPSVTRSVLIVFHHFSCCP